MSDQDDEAGRRAYEGELLTSAAPKQPIQRATPTRRIVWAVYTNSGQLWHVEPEDSEQRAWTIALGWPSAGEIEEYKHSGWRAERSELRPLEDEEKTT